MNRFRLAYAMGLSLLPILVPSAAHAATVTVSVGGARLVEPPSGQKSMIFPVALSGLWSEDVRVSYATSVGPNATTADPISLAQPGFDFSSRQGQITIPAGTTRGQIEIPILSDAEVEKDETFVVTLSNVQGYNNSGATVVLNPRATAALGVIVEPVKGVVLGGQVSTYNVNPYAYNYDPTTGQYVDTFNTAAQQTLPSGVSVTVKGDNNFSRTVTTDAQGKFTALVRPGTYSVKVENFYRQDSNGVYQLYSQPARTVSLARDVRNANFYFYGVAGTVGYTNTNSTVVYPAYVRVEARPYGASPTSTPIASDIADNSDTGNVSRGYRYSIPALPPGRYTLTIAGVSNSDYYTTYFTFPSVTVNIPTSLGVNRPFARVDFVGKPKTITNSTRSTRSSSAYGS